MPLLHLSLWFQPIPTTTVRVIAVKAKDRNTVITTADFTAPHINPRLVSIYVPTYETYTVYIYKNATVSSNGLLVGDWDVEPRADVASIVTDTEMVVGRGTATDPANGSGSFIIPGANGLVINRIFKLGVGALPSYDWQQISGVDIDGNPSIGIELLGNDEEGNPIVFNTNEEFRVEYKIAVDSNAATLIAELSQDLDDHINNTSNPHGVTKAQVGLGNLPNAKSDAINLADSNTLATSAAVNALRLTIVDAIAYKGQVDIGLLGGNQDRHTLVTHGQNINPANYMVIGTLEGYSSAWSNDNDTTVTISNKTNNSFYVDVHQLGTSSANLKFNFIIIKF